MELFGSEKVFRLEHCCHSNHFQVKDVFLVDSIMNVNVNKRELTLWESIDATSLFAGAQERSKIFVMRVWRVRTCLVTDYGVSSGRDCQATGWLQDCSAGVVSTEIFVRRPGGDYRCLARCQSESRDLMLWSRRALESASGSSTKYGLKVKGLNGGRYNVGVTFHPRDYLWRKMQETKKHSDDQTIKETYVLSNLITRDY